MSFAPHANIKVRQAAYVWRLLRKPFALPPCSFSHHECQYERIDMDILGCLLCGHVHACCDGDCQDVVETDDSSVCLLSGVVIRDKKFVVDEYMDTQTLNDMPVSNRVFDEECSHEQIEAVVRLLLHSSTSRTLYLRQMALMIEKWLLRLKNCENLCATLCSLMQEAASSGSISNYDADVRKELIAQTTHAIYKCLQILVCSFGMPMKLGELPNVATGMLYLMRAGLFFENVVILPTLPILRKYLPSENSLLHFFDIKAKIITECENRVRFCLRNTTMHQLKEFGFTTQ